MSLPVQAPIRVLVCGDQAVVRAGFGTVIDDQADLEVVGRCGDGRAAVDLAGELRPDVVVMDVRVPVLDGTGATRLLAGPSVEPSTKVLVVTTFDLDEHVDETLRADASGFPLEDARPAQLPHGIRTVAAGTSLLAPGATRQLVGRHASRIRSARRAQEAGGSPPEVAWRRGVTHAHGWASDRSRAILVSEPPVGACSISRAGGARVSRS